MELNKIIIKSKINKKLIYDNKKVKIHVIFEGKKMIKNESLP